MLQPIQLACQGMKTVKCAELQSMWDYRKKQKKKVAKLESLRQAASDGAGPCLIQDVNSMEMARIEAAGQDQTEPGIQGRM